MKFCGAPFRALMRRNLIYRKRRWIASIFEFVLPVFAIAILYLIKLSVSDTEGLAAETVAPTFAEDADAIIPFSMQDYATALQAKRVCVDYDGPPPDPLPCLANGGSVADCCPAGAGSNDGVCILLYCVDLEDLTINEECNCAQIETACGQLGMFLGFVEGMTEMCDQVGTCCANGTVENDAFNACMQEAIQDPPDLSILEGFADSAGMGDTVQTAEEAPSSKPLSISGMASDMPVPFVFCDPERCKEDGQSAADFCLYRVLALAPEKAGGSGAARVQQFKSYIETTYPQVVNKTALPFEYDFIKVFETSDDMDAYVTSANYGGTVNDEYQPKIGIAVVFGDAGEKKYDYTIRVNSTNYNIQYQAAEPVAKTTPPTSRVFNNFARKDSESCPPQGGVPYLGRLWTSCTGLYVYNGALPIQRLVDDWIHADAGLGALGVRVAENAVSFVPFPTKEYTTDGFYGIIAPFFPLLVILGLLYPISAGIRGIVLEKELRQKELMKMMSISESDIGWSWFLSLFIFNMITAVFCAVFTNLVYSNSQFAFLLVFWIITFVAFICYCMAIAAFSAKSTRATLVGILVFFIGYFLTIASSYDTGSVQAINALSLHPVAAFAYALLVMGYLEDAGVGLNSNTIISSDFPSRLTFGSCIFMLIVDCFLWGFASWYLNRVLRGDFGTALPFYFPFTKQYWCPAPQQQNDGVAVEQDPDVPVEQVSELLKQQKEGGKGVYIHDLRKQFGEKTAVEGLSLSMYSGQITCLLGHNGAGKTTTIGMLTGMIPPTSGYASVAGNDIRTDLNSLRENVGICLQHDCLFPQLTVREHVQFFSRVKGLYHKKSKEEAEASVMAAIEDVALLEKKNTFSKDLSGGMKRKLSVAIAFCGDSNVVFLDEPTSGMDPFARRFTWNVIRQYRENRCIVLTTHFMDEADLLGDRIAIMSEGRLRCAGSSLFLKSHYGVGYQLTIIKKSGNAGGKSLEDDEEGIGKILEDIVKGSVPDATMLSNVGTECSFQLPISSSSEFVGMFEQLDKQKDIDTYGVSVTTLDEVFLMVARGEDGTHKKIEALPNSDNPSASGAGNSYRLSTEFDRQATFSRHVRALFLKRAMNFKRDKKAWCCSSIFPTLMVLLGFLITTFVLPSRNDVSLTLSLGAENPDVIEDRNPIMYNNPGDFKCRPGSCISSTPSFNIAETEEVYSFCGEQASIGNATCTISDSNAIIDQITQDGAFGVGKDVTDIKSASLSLAESSTDYAATQYSAILFTHDAASTANLNGVSGNYDDMVSKRCQETDDTYTSDEQCSKYEGIGYVVNYNFTSLHSSLLYQSLVDEAILRQSLGDPDYKISVKVWSLPITYVEENYAAAADAFIAWFLLVVSFPFIAGSFGMFVVAERESKAKHLQTVAGVKPKAYWFSTYCWDVLNYQIPLWTIIILMYALGIEAFTSKEGDAGAATIILMILFGPAAAGFTYIISFLFKSPSMCNLFTIVFNFFIGMAGPMVVLILRTIGGFSPELSHLTTAATAVEWVLRFIPSFNLGKGLLYVINMELLAYFDGGPASAFSPSISRYEIIFLAWQAILYTMIASMVDILSTKPKVVQQFQAIVDFLICKCGKTVTTPVAASVDDEDVAAENERVLSGSADSELIILKDLSKRYRNGKLAVDHMSLAIPAGECFGLLGINGAGKTTTMGMITAEFPPTGGDAILGGFSVSNEPEQTRRRIGYCPQFDAHFMNMTGREHVELYAAIKGVEQNVVKEAVAAKLTEVGLSEFDSNRLSAGYSGGMKRKLSVACATIGQPQIVFLDEPSTGMDPVARRDLWKVISRMVQGNGNTDEGRTSVILTTHSMEECEALCPRIGIMAGGRLRCLGSAQHLKTRFGRGYQIEMKIKHASDEDEDVQNTLNNFLQFLNVELANSEDVGDGRRLSRTESCRIAADTTMKLDRAKQACQQLTGDNFLSEKLDPANPIGYHIYKSASSHVGVAADDLAAFCVEELRMKTLVDFFNESYSTAILRERQDTKARFEIGSDGVTISSVFANIEENKARLMLDDYGVSQTSLEQVFNMHAAEAEEAKKNASM